MTMQTKDNISRYLFILITILISQYSFSQSNYLDGYIINLKGDTIFGLIDYRNWDTNPNKIDFKHKTDNAAITYTPLNIIEFRVHDEIYVSGIVNSEISPTLTARLEKDATINLKIDTAFLQILIKGNKNLYLYKDSQGKSNFYIKKDTNYELLIHKKYLTETNYGRLAINENKKFIGQLNFYFADCFSMQSTSKGLKYNRTSMQKLFEDYYKQTQKDILFKNKIEKVSIEIGVLAGMSVSNLVFKSLDFFYLTEINYKQSSNFTAGIFFDIIQPRSLGKWSVNNELLYTSYSMTGSYNNYEHENKYVIKTTELGYSYIKMNNLLRYKYQIGKMYIYINGGISNGYAIKEVNLLKKESKLYTTYRIDYEKAIDTSRRYEQGLILGLGAKYNKWSLEIRYEGGNGMSDYSFLNSSTTRLYFLLGYIF